MTEPDLRAEAEAIEDELPAAVELSIPQIEEKLTTFVINYQVPLEEARRSIISKTLDNAGIDQSSRGGGNPDVDLSDVNEPDEWIDVTAEVVELWEPRSDAIGQVGLIGDETGTLKFTAWAKSDLPNLEEGGVYRLGNVVTDEYQGRYSVKLNRTTTIEELDQEIVVGDNTTTMTGALVDVQSGSGLIKRCPAEGCTRVLSNDRCSEHGDVNGEFDMRIKGVIDNGEASQEVIFNRETTEEAIDLTLEDAKEKAKDALDTSVVEDTVREATIGEYFEVEGPILGRYLLVDDFSQLNSAPDPDAVIARARSM